jgi:hypothetical protein
MPLAFLVLLALAAATVLSWCGVVAHGTLFVESTARFHAADGGRAASPPSPVPEPEPPAEQPADTVASPAPAPGGVRPVEATPPPGTGPTSSATGSAVTATEARPGRPCQPEGGTVRGRNGVLLRCTSPPSDKQPRWHRIS